MSPDKSKGPCYFVTSDKVFDFFLNSCIATVQPAITIALFLGEERAYKQGL